MKINKQVTNADESKVGDTGSVAANKLAVALGTNCMSSSYYIRKYHPIYIHCDIPLNCLNSTMGKHWSVEFLLACLGVTYNISPPGLQLTKKHPRLVQRDAHGSNPVQGLYHMHKGCSQGLCQCLTGLGETQTSSGSQHGPYIAWATQKRRGCRWSQ